MKFIIIIIIIVVVVGRVLISSVSAGKNSAPAGRICVKFDVGDLTVGLSDSNIRQISCFIVNYIRFQPSR